MKDINAAKELIKDDGVVIASLSGSSMDEWITMCQMVNETKADWVELNNSCPFAADMGVKMGSGAVDLTYQFVKACKEVMKKPFSVKITPQTNDPLALAKQVRAGRSQCRQHVGPALRNDDRHRDGQTRAVRRDGAGGAAPTCWATG